jgi:hypothetical protein
VESACGGRRPPRKVLLILPAGFCPASAAEASKTIRPKQHSFAFSVNIRHERLGQRRIDHSSFESRLGSAADRSHLYACPVICASAFRHWAINLVQPRPLTPPIAMINCSRYTCRQSSQFLRTDSARVITGQTIY